MVGRRNTSLRGILILHALSGYLRRFIKKRSREKPDMVSRDKCTKLIHDPRSRPKGEQSHKRPQKYLSLSMGKKSL